MRVEKKNFVRFVRIHVKDGPAFKSKRLQHVDLLSTELLRDLLGQCRLGGVGQSAIHAITR